MIVIGGTYVEVCLEPSWNNIYGSGFRAVNVLLENDSNDITFLTCADKQEIIPHLNFFSTAYPRLTIQTVEIEKTPSFYYDHPLKTPIITPRPDLLFVNKPTITAEGENILAYGMIEASIQMKGNKVVYDPQSPVNPISFTNTNSSAKQLIYVVNLDEAKKITFKTEINEIKDYFFDVENCYALIVKMGAKGAILFESKTKRAISIPVFETKKVWNIGSGDVFSAIFAKNWFDGKSLTESATLASKATAIYCNTKSLTFSNVMSKFSFPELHIKEKPSGQVYLAGPFFTYAQRWLINEIYNTFLSMGLKVFSPFHHVGYGKAEDVVEADIQGIHDSNLLFAVVDGLDSGTLFEVGYAIANDKTVIAFSQNEGEEAIKMLEGTDCIIESDLTTAFYKTYWLLGK